MNANEKRILTELDFQVGVKDDPNVDYKTGPDYKKVPSDIAYGDKVEIHWTGLLNGVIDKGYVLGWPGTHYDADPNLSGVIHVPHPQNPGGIGDVEAEWVTLWECIKNTMIRKVIRCR